MPQPSDQERLGHIIEAIDWIDEFTNSMDLADFRTDRKTQLSVERSLEIIGEAANHISPDLIVQYPDVPWRKIADLRNVLSHEYFQVRLEIIWQVVTEDVPALRDLIDTIMRDVDKE